MVASITTATLSVDRLLQGGPYHARPITLLAGEVLARGAVLGRITIGAVTAAPIEGGNTGDGTLTLDPATPVLAHAEVGVYKVRCIAAAVDGGTFRVTGPRGHVLGDVEVGDAWTNQIAFSIADGAAADFIVGDGWDITVAAGSGKYRLATAAALDGSAEPDAILVEAAGDAQADAEAQAYTVGTFGAAALTIGSGHTLDSIRAPLRLRGIHLVPIIGA